MGRRLDISRAHAYRLVASGELPSLRLGHRTVVPVWALEAILTVSRSTRSTPVVGVLTGLVDTSGEARSSRPDDDGDDDQGDVSC